MKKYISIFFALQLIFVAQINAQKLKYQTDIVPILKGQYTINCVEKLQIYYNQNLDEAGKPSKQAMDLLRDKLSAVCLHIGHSYEANARKYINYPSTDTALRNVDNAIVWYNKVTNDLKLKNDTLVKYVQRLQIERQQWISKSVATKNAMLAQQRKEQAEITESKESFESSLVQIEAMNATRAAQLRAKHKNAKTVLEWRQAALDAHDLLSDMNREADIREAKLREASERKQMLQKQMDLSEKQHVFLTLQKQCAEENVCPNCPINIAIQFRNAYYAGDIKAMQSLIVDYYGDQKLFYQKDINLYKTLSATELSKLSQQFKSLTADFKRIDPTEVVYYTDNETRDFYIDKNYKSSLLHATVFKAINDFDKIDLVKYNGQWKVYRVGGAYAGRSGNTIVGGRFFFDSSFLQKEVKRTK